MNIELTKEECGYLIDAIVAQLDYFEHYVGSNKHTDAYITLLEKLEAIAIKS